MLSLRLSIMLLAAVAAGPLHAAPTPKDQLMVPPANAEHFVIVSEAGKHGDEWRWTLPDGSIRTGSLDGEGRARLNGIPPGQCQIKFPQKDKNELRRG